MRIIAGRVNASDRKITSGCVECVCEEALPERERLRVRVIHAEQGHTVIDPLHDNVLDGLVDAFGIVVEVQRIDVLVLLRRVLCVSDRAVSACREPLGDDP